MKQLSKTAAFWAAVLLVWEFGFHWMIRGGVSPRFLFSVPFTLGAAGILAVLSHLWRAPLANKITRFVLLTALLVIFAVQTVYYQVFGSLLSLSYVVLGGDAIGGFLPIVVSGILGGIPLILLYLLPYPVLALLQRRGVLRCEPVPPSAGVLLGSVSILVYALGVPPAGGGGSAAVYYDYQAAVDRQAEYFGLLTAERLELGRLFSDETGLSGGGFDLQEGGGAARRNIMPEIDMGALKEAAANDSIQELNSYFAGRSGTAQNEYTGRFKGYNYIQICAEAYSPYFVDPELTPTLYRLTHEGIVFRNFYNSFSNLTSNGEYSLCMGLMPDMGRLSFATTIDNYIPFTLARFFKAEGRRPLAYHNNYATFYNRINTHTNMGYEFRGIDYGLDMEPDLPTSDLEMMEKSVDEYIYSQPFAVHYMTYSGHAPYGFTVNSMSGKNRERVEAMALDCSEELRAYYACQLELEDALRYLVERLEAAGIAERTVIVLTGDHYPYGLSDAAYEELAGDAVDTDPFWRYRGSFVCWTGALEEPIYIDDYCCTQDILPTVCNLFGLPYESRMLTGLDVLADCTHMALLQDGSFLTEALTYDSGSGTVTYFQPEETLPAGYAEKLIQAAKNQFSVGAAILRNDYYAFVFSALHLADSTEPVLTGQPSFSDIGGQWYEESVERLLGQGALSNNVSKYCGDEVCTRAMFVNILSRCLYLEPAEGTDMPFRDVPEDTWYYTSVAAGLAAGLIPPGELFYPEEPLTEADARTIFTAAAGCAGVEDAGQWADEALNRVFSQARDAGEDTRILSRGAAAVLIASLIGV